MDRGYKIREGAKADSKQLVKLLQTFAEFEHKKLPDQKGRARFIKDIFDRKLAYLLVATSKEKLIGYALYFYTYASFQAKPVLYLEDIFVLEEYRRLGVGLALFRRCAKEALKHHCSRMEWAVLTWNKNAMNFYEKLGAKKQNLFIYRIDSPSLSYLIEPSHVKNPTKDSGG